MTHAPRSFPARASPHDAHPGPHDVLITDSSGTGGLSRLTYASLAGVELRTPQGLKQLVSHASRRNAQRGLTGCLLHHDGLIVQWLEGPEEQVTHLWRAIKADPRHGCVAKLLHAHDLGERVFADWNMESLAAGKPELLAIIREARRAHPAGDLYAWAPVIDSLVQLLEAQDGVPDLATVRQDIERLYFEQRRAA
jgi:hypothetical protein